MRKPQLASTAHGLAAQVLAGRFWVLRWSRMLGWTDLGLGITVTGVGCGRILVPAIGAIPARSVALAGLGRAWS